MLLPLKSLVTGHWSDHSRQWPQAISIQDPREHGIYERASHGPDPPVQSRTALPRYEFRVNDLHSLCFL